MMIRVLAATAAGLMAFSGTAAAYPIQGVPELTHNALYKKGKLPKISCKLTKGTTKSSTTTYLNTLVGCLNDAWGPFIPDFQPVKTDIRAAFEKGPCYNGIEITGSFVTTCYSQLQVQLAADWISAKDDLPIRAQVVQAWSGVVMGQTGIGAAYWAMPNDADEKQLDEQGRRFDMQRLCLSGVTLKALGAKSKNWKATLKAEEPTPKDKRWRDRFSKDKLSANDLHWFTQGYTKGTPGACNTWKAPESKVA
ncbi:hypothetical protein [Nonomuraea sp. NPDC001831]|uniref:hypothetical protein n=1 Tax=Nonomuraea sp. NPDC001831 TaxID=3364340 RepID=UPI0036CD344E